MNEQKRISDVASSSNSSSTLSSKKYDVFLSFHGKDTRYNFTSHLHEALIRDKIETFIDDRLEKGDEISLALVKAIEDSRISVVIFSEKYASSKWCLNELSKIMELKREKRQIVIPVFYMVDPFHVRHQIGSYKEAFDKHEGQPMCSKWKDALTEAANLSGWHYSQNRTEAELLKDIVQDVLEKLAPTYPNQRKRLVGIEESYEKIESLLKIGSSKVITIGIWGMGGIGKTTLATTLYDKLSYQFEGRCFLANVREKSGNLEALRDELFSTLLDQNKSHGFDNSDMRRLRRKKVFIVLDDVSTSEQLEKLIEENDFLGAGSRVIVTARDKQILSTITEIYPVEELNSHHSLQLFCLTVFGEKQPKQGYEDLSRRVISYCEGVPLALKVLGASLRERSKKAWECELRKLEKFPNMKIHKVLKLSYDDLDHAEKDIFLDIACFFKGEARNEVTRILEAFDFFPASGIEVLLDKALITISKFNTIEMHDLIQEMGREIVHQESEKYLGKGSRLWKHEEVLDVLKDNKGTDDIEGIVLDLLKLKGNLNLSSDFLANMTNVRFLKIHEGFPRLSNGFNVYLRDGLESLSDKLRYLRWDRCSLESWPLNFCAKQLVELHMKRSNLKKLWDGVQDVVNLKTIDLSNSRKLVEIPNLSKAEKLEEVNLGYCISLRQLHPSMFSLSKLTYLYVNSCIKIESLKSNVHSKSLCVLKVNNCSSLKEFSITSEEMTKLDLADTALSELSPSICQLLSLEELDLSRTNVESLPANIKNLSMLTSLQLSDCQTLVSLPELPPSLRELHLDCCCKLVSLPELPPTLIELRLNNCQKLVSLPELPLTLIRLHLNNCRKLVSLPKLPPNLIELPLNNCQKLVSLPELPPTLVNLYLNNCWKPKSLPELPSSLRKLYLNGCRKIMSLPKLPPSLAELCLNNCWKLEFLPELTSSLRKLYLKDCGKLMSLPELPPSLTTLYLNDCRKLMSLPELPPSLTALYLNNFQKLMSLPKLPLSVKWLSAFNCISLETDTQGLVLNHMSQGHIPNLHEKYLKGPIFCYHGTKLCGFESGCFIFPGDHVTDEYGFHIADSLITISYLPKSDLLGFICYIVLSKEQDLDVPDDDGLEDDVSDDDGSEDEDGLEYDYREDYVSIHIYEDDVLDDDGSEYDYPDDDGIEPEVCLGNIPIEWPRELIADHVFFSYVDIGKIHRISKVCDQFSNITFKFELKNQKERIKGCGVFPVYATTSGLKLVNSQQLLEWESITQISGNEALARAIGVRGSNNENSNFLNGNQLLKSMIVVIYLFFIITYVIFSLFEK